MTGVRDKFEPICGTGGRGEVDGEKYSTNCVEPKAMVLY